jgi:hypothetical protein
MRTIIAGSRWIVDAGVLENALHACPFSSEITEVVHGDAKGVDRLAKQWAIRNGIPHVAFPARWRAQDGTMDPGAGHTRNERMAGHSDALLAVWDGLSGGTADMIRRAEFHRLRIFIFRVAW